MYISIKDAVFNLPTLVELLLILIYTYNLFSERTRHGPTKIGFSVHRQTTPCHRETNFDSIVMLKDEEN